MTPIVLQVAFGGEWQKKNETFKWTGDTKLIAFVVDPGITLAELVEKLYVKLNVDSKKTNMQLSYASNSWDLSNHPIYLTSDECVIALLNSFDEKGRRGTLRVELKEKEGGCEENDRSGNLERVHFEEPVEMENEQDLEQNNESFDNGNHEEHNEDDNCNNDNQEEHLRDSFFSDVVFEKVVCDGASSLVVDEINIVGTEVLSQNVNSDNLERPDPEFVVGNDSRSTDIEASALYSFTDGSGFVVGQNFVSKEELKNRLHEVAINNCFEMRIINSSTSLYVVKCVDDKCTWRLRAAKITNSSYFSIRTYNNTHTCGLEKRKRKHRQASAALVGDMVKQICAEDSKYIPTPKGIIGMMSKLGVEVTYWKAWMAKKIANNLRRGSPEENFASLPIYLYMVKKVNPGTITHLEVDDNNMFKYLFLAFGSCIRGFLCMRKVISIDGTFL